ncbi:MAG: DUF4097 family beta strand repeat protein [Clostridia bacterium]|nr:DUF4097 family beta strand repeat protein [Clostridia bacterium]
MSRSKRIWLIAAAVLTVLGAALFIYALIALGFDMTKLSPVKPVENIYEIDEDFDRIAFELQTSDVTILPSDDGVCRIECREADKMRHTADVEGTFLKIGLDDTREWYERLLFNPRDIGVTLYVPEEEYASISVSVSTGDVTVEPLKVTSGVKIGCSTGDVHLNDLTCGQLAVDTSTGDVFLNGVAVSGSLTVRCTTGDVWFDRCDAESISVGTTTGDVTGTFLTEKIFSVDTSTGDVNVPESASGGRCDVSTSTGDVNIKIK